MVDEQVRKNIVMEALIIIAVVILGIIVLVTLLEGGIVISNEWKAAVNSGTSSEFVKNCWEKIGENGGHVVTGVLMMVLAVIAYLFLEIRLLFKPKNSASYYKVNQETTNTNQTTTQVTQISDISKTKQTMQKKNRITGILLIVFGVCLPFILPRIVYSIENYSLIDLYEGFARGSLEIVFAISLAAIGVKKLYTNTWLQENHGNPTSVQQNVSYTKTNKHLSDESIQQLEKIATLKERGILTQEEFDLEKRKILD